MIIKPLAASAIFVLSGHAALAQSAEYMQEDCANLAQGYYQNFEAETETTYEGTRTDGSHAVNGTISLETHGDDFQCSYNKAGDTLIGFFAEGKDQPDFVKGGASPYSSSSSQASSGDSAEQTGVASDEAAKVEFAQGESSINLQGAIRGQEYFDYALTAKKDQMIHIELSVADTNGDGTIYFNLLAPGSTGEAMYNGSMDGNVVEMRLTESGAYVIRLYLMGNDRDADKTVGYNLDVSIN